MTTKKAVIIEDQEEGINNLKNMLQVHCPHVKIIAEARSVAEAIITLNKKDIQPDVVFFDIRMEDGLAFEVFDYLHEVNFEIIFVTAYEQYAIKACKYSSIGFILKPIDGEELVDCVSRIPDKSDKMGTRLELFSNVYNNPNAFNRISINSLNGIDFLPIQDIRRLEGDDNYTHFYLKDGTKITASRTIKFYTDMLESVNFYRIHKKHLINLNYMTKYLKNTHHVVMDDGLQFEVSRRRRKDFIKTVLNAQKIS